MDRESAESWLTGCRLIAVQVRALAATTPPSSRRALTGRIGAGGDSSLALDVAAEQIAIRELTRVARRHDRRVWVESEESGRLSLGAGEADPPMTLSLDPLDGSSNIRAGVPIAALSVAVSTSDEMRDVELGFVADLFRPIDYWAWRDRDGTFHVSETIGSNYRQASEPECVAIEHAPPAELAKTVAALPASVHYVRVPGASALSLALLSSGAFDAVIAAKPLRPFDVAAGQLLVRAAGGAVFLGASEPSLDAHTRLPLVAAARPGWLDALTTDAGSSPLQAAVGLVD